MVQAGGVDTSSWETANLQQLVRLFERSKEAKQYLFIWDKQGSVGTFMQYKGHLVQLGPPTLRAALGQGTIQDVGETARKGFIAAMRSGDNMCLDIDQAKTNFSAANQEGTWVANQFFDWNWLEQEENYMKYVREDENHGIGGVNPGMGYIRNAKFGCAIRSGAGDEATLAE